MSALAEAALAYAEHGIHVFPLRPREKKPYGRTNGKLSATADVETVRGWWSGKIPLPLSDDAKDRRPVYARPDSNIGIATGRVSGFWVLDLDGLLAEQALEALIALRGPLPETVEQRTGGGRHLCFAWDDAFNIRISASEIGEKIDVRGNGGYIVAPPSIHPGDKAKGVAPGRVYAWCAGRAPGDMPFTPAPEWLSRLAEKVEAAPAPAKPLQLAARTGRATPYGEAVLRTSCRTVSQAAPGNRRMAVFKYAAFLGGYVAGGEIERGYAKECLTAAGLAQATDKPWSAKDLDQLIENGLRKGELHPETAPTREGVQPATPRPTSPAKTTPAQVAIDIRDARSLWNAARAADCGAVRDWLRIRGLDPKALPDTLGRMRAHAGAPLSPSHTGPGLLIPLTDAADADWDAEVSALAVIPLLGNHERPTHFVGDRTRKVALLSAPAAEGDLLVALDLQDLWALGASCAESGHEVGLVLAPTLKAFAGGWLGDKFGRADAETPCADPNDPPWSARGARMVWLAVRNDLRTPELRTRRTFGGTRRAAVEGELAARFFGGLAEQAWKRAGATKVHLLRPSRGIGFSKRWGA